MRRRSLNSQGSSFKTGSDVGSRRTEDGCLDGKSREVGKVRSRKTEDGSLDGKIREVGNVRIRSTEHGSLDGKKSGSRKSPRPGLNF